MSDERIERLGQIADITWSRHFDDRLGISHDEQTRMERTPAAALPAVERLLADKDAHVIHRRHRETPADEADRGFQMEVPEHEYNNGELHNLAIRRGTLNGEERYKINHHIIQTIVMLEKLPFPKHLENVPEFAAGHHEKMDGTGYPRRLERDEMSVPARIMAIADIFEALTASDRPYKKAKSLAESIRIMGFMRKDQHIDPEIFKLFLESGVYRKYAEAYLSPEQIDEVDIEPYLEDL